MSPQQSLFSSVLFYPNTEAQSDHDPRPFTGTRILDFTQVLAGPFGSFQLALLGAEIIKVERREGEDMRRTPLSREWADRGMAPAWLAINGNKRSLTLDLQKPAAVEIVKRLVANADVVMENFRAGVMDRLGIGYAALSEINPRLIYCAVSGFGQTGPYSNEAGYDGKIQALSGIMSLTGHAEMGRPAPASRCATCCPHDRRLRRVVGLFQRTIPARASSSMCRCWRRAWLSSRPGCRLYRCRAPAGAIRQPGDQPQGHRQPVRANNSFLLLAVNNDKQYEALMRTIGRADVLDDPRFADWFQRKEHEAALRAIIEEALAAADAKTWEKTLNDAGAPCASIWRIEEVIDHPQIVARGPCRPWRRRMGRCA